MSAAYEYDIPRYIQLVETAQQSQDSIDPHGLTDGILRCQSVLSVESVELGYVFRIACQLQCLTA